MRVCIHGHDSVCQLCMLWDCVYASIHKTFYYFGVHSVKYLFDLCLLPDVTF